MKHLLLMLATVLSIFAAKAQDLVFDGITPASGSRISSFDFVLKFNLSNVVKEYGEGEYGVGYIGYHNDKRPQKEQSVTIYKGAVSDDIVIGRCNETALTGGMVGFNPNSSEVSIHIEGVIPEPDVEYTMVISNEFKVYKDNNPAPLANANFDCFTTPITYTFTGSAVSAEKLNIASCSVSSNQNIETLNEVIFTFSQPVSVNSANPLVVKENDVVFATSIDAVLSDDKKTVTYKFDSVSLRLGHSYVISLPDGAVSSDANASETNIAFNVPVTGTSVGHFMLVSSIPNAEQKTIFSTIEGIFDMPEGLQIYKSPEFSLNLDGSLYKDTVAEENLLGKLNGESNSTNNGIVWTNGLTLYPASTYVLYIPAGQFRARDVATGKLVTDWYNGEVNIILNTPSVEEAGVPKVEFQAPVLGIYDADGDNVTLNNGDKISEITTINFLLKDLRYYYNGEKVNWGEQIGNDAVVEIYDITEDTPLLIKSARFSSKSYGPDSDPYSVKSANINTIFFEGHKYKLVIPAGTFTANKNTIRNYALNDEYSLEFEGATPSSVDLIDCTLPENAEVSELASVIWRFKGDFAYDDTKSVICLSTPEPTYVSSKDGVTTVKAFFSDTFNPTEPWSPRPGADWWVEVPEGLLYYAADPSIRNEAIRVNFTGVEKTPEVVAPEFVNLTVEINGVISAMQQAVKGETVEVTLTPDDDWKVGKLLRNGSDVTDRIEDGVYVTPALTANTWIEAEIEYAGKWAVEQSGIWEIEGTSIRIYGENGKIVVEGVSAADKISVYSVNGLKVNDTEVAEGNDNVEITVAPGQTYIVSVNGVSAKIQL